MARPSESAGLVDLISSGLGVTALPDLTRWKRVDAEAVPGLPEHQIVRRGDVWLLGDHRLACGDSTDPRCVAALLGAERPHLMVTDPPYGVNYNPGWRNVASTMWSAPRSIGIVNNDARVDWAPAWRLFPGDVAYVWHADRYAAAVQASIEAAGLVIRSQIIWAKQHFVFGRGDYHYQHELCWYAVRKGAKGRWSSDRKQSTIWEIRNASAMGGSGATDITGHGTQKPVECMRRPILNNSVLGDAVYEPFCGSGTTIIAAEMEGRRCFAIELNPLYVYISILRWQDFTGKTASLGDESFHEVLARRQHEGVESVPDEAPLQVPSSDPVLAELVYRWYPPLDNVVVDPYPDSVRGAVARAMGLHYTLDGDGMLLMCPSLEGTLDYSEFLWRFLADVRRLAPRALACVVARDGRWTDGNLYGFPGHAVEAFAEAGMRLAASHALALPEGRVDLLVFRGYANTKMK